MEIFLAHMMVLLRSLHPADTVAFTFPDFSFFTAWERATHGHLYTNIVVESGRYLFCIAENQSVPVYVTFVAFA